MKGGRFTWTSEAAKAFDILKAKNRGENLIRRFVGRGNELDPRDINITSLKQQIQGLEFSQLQLDSPAEEAETESNVWDDALEDVNPFGGGIPGFHMNTMITLFYDTDIKDVTEDEEYNIEDVVVEVNDLCSLMIQTILSVDFEKDINTKSHELMSFGKSMFIKDDGLEDVNAFGGGNPGFHDDHYDNPLLTKETESEPIIWDIGDEEEEYPFVNKYPKEKLMLVYDTDIEDVNEEEEDNIEDVVVVANDLSQPMVDKLGFKTIKVRGRVVIKKGNLMHGIQVWMLRIQGTSEANSRMSFSQAWEDDADALTLILSRPTGYSISKDPEEELIEEEPLEEPKEK
ncbi:hypothetical protein Tco_0090304, partial [Tanacetum coccineum]